MSSTGDSISPLDGRYGDRLGHLASFFSERALMRERCRVEVRWVEALATTGLFAPLTAAEQARLGAAAEGFSTEDFDRIKVIEEKTRHDVKSCELFLRERLQLANPNLVHFGLTSEDVNNLAWSRLFDAYRTQAQLPLLDRLIGRLVDLASRWRAVPLPTRTHGQRASPSTAGKELAVFLSRLVRLRGKLSAFRFWGKVNGATGNCSAMVAAFPAFDWLTFNRGFVERQGLLANPATTQIEDHDAWAEYFNLVRQVDNVVLDLDQDAWLYLSFGLWREAARAGEVGSSTMPHKVNPIRFENSEGNLQVANALLVELSNKLCRSRLQRDLSDSTVTRNVGVALAHAHLAWEETLAGLERVEVDEARCRAELEASPELLAEPMQTILRTAGVEDPYEVLKQATRGRSLSLEELRAVVDGLAVPVEVKARLRALQVTEYVGVAPHICDEVVAAARKELGA